MTSGGFGFFFAPGVYLVMLALYGLSLVLFYVDFLRDNAIANRSGMLLLGIVWVLETLFLGSRVMRDHVLPLFTSDQATILFAWLLISLSFVVNLVSRIDYFTFFINLLGFLFVGFDVMVHGVASDTAPRVSDILLLHVSVAFLSYLAFTVSSIFSLLYLLEDRALRGKRFASGPFRRLPPLERLELFAYRSALVGGPLLFIAMLLGAIWYQILTGQVLLLDPKPIATLLLFGVYVVYLVLRAQGRISGRKASWWNLAAFAGVLVNFLVIGEFMSKFHRW